MSVVEDANVESVEVAVPSWMTVVAQCRRW
jgi:hypothetical protein